MHFLLKINKKDKILIKNISSDKELINSSSSILYISDKTTNYSEFVSNKGRIILIGDIVLDTTVDHFRNTFPQDLADGKYLEYGGFYYLIHLDEHEVKYKIYTSLFNILPIYYYDINDEIYVSSNQLLITKACGKNFEINKKYILETVLFNYAFNDETLFKEIKLVPSNHHIEIDNKINIIKHLEISDLFVQNPQKGKNILEELSLKFIERACKYFPETRFGISLTGGFDGRTLTAAALKSQKNFFTYSFGKDDSQDLTIPLSQTKRMGLEFYPISLDAKYVTDHAATCGQEIIKLTEGTASFSRAHYRYAAELLSAKTNYIITGNFGSDIFRAFNVSGVMIARETKYYFERDNTKEWIDLLKTSKKLKALNLAEYKLELEEFIEELENFKRVNSHLQKNKLLYKYIFEEVFRKYFGPEIVMQSFFINNRAPYLDYIFLKSLLNTNYAGVYSDFYTHNPIKRFKGQLPYAYIIKNSYHELLYLNTIKGYRPLDLLTITGKANLIISKYFKKKIDSTDPYSVKASLEKNKNIYLNKVIIKDYFNPDFIKSILNTDTNTEDTNYLTLALSINYFIHNIYE